LSSAAGIALKSLKENDIFILLVLEETHMVSFERHLVTQRLGRVFVTVQVDTSGNGKVALTSERLPSLGGALDFTMAELAELCGKGKSWVELATRLAVAKAHRLCRPKDQGGQPLCGRLDLHVRPWIGDITLVPFGGATEGVEAKMAAIKARRFAPRRYL
jgi:hypothetical protein